VLGEHFLASQGDLSQRCPLYHSYDACRTLPCIAGWSQPALPFLSFIWRLQNTSLHRRVISASAALFIIHMTLAEHFLASQGDLSADLSAARVRTSGER
jgi:hypothetical protein